MESLGDRIAEHAAHLDAATHRLLADLRAFDQGGGWYPQGARSCAQWLSWRVGWDRATAREHVRVANKLGELPHIDDALRLGEVSYSKVRAMTRVATPENEEVLLEESRFATANQLERICRKYASVLRHENDGSRPQDDVDRRYVTRRDTEDGMVQIKALLHPEEAALVWAALDRVAGERCRQRAAGVSPTVGAAGAKALDRVAGEGCRQRAAGVSPTVGAAGASALDRAAGVSPTVGAAGAKETAVASASLEPSVSVGVSAETKWSRDHGDLQDLGSAVQPSTVRPRSAAECRELERATNFDRADALVAIAQDVVRGTSRDRSPIELVLTMDADTLQRRTRDRHQLPPAPPDAAKVASKTDDPCDVACFADGACLSAEGARRLACDCGVIEVVEDEHGIPLSVGRRTRTIPGAMKRALLRRDQTCRFPGCTTRVFLEGHHIEHWADGGETKLANMVSMCSYHHRHVHEYKFVIENSDRGEIRFVDGRGRPVKATPAPARPARLGWDTIREANEHLSITDETGACGWDGLPVDYDLAILALVRADGL